MLSPGTIVALELNIIVTVEVEPQMQLEASPLNSNKSEHSKVVDKPEEEP